MNEFDKTFRLALPFVLVLTAVVAIAFFVSGSRLPFAIRSLGFFGGVDDGNQGSAHDKNWVEPSWETQVNAVRTGQSDRIEVKQSLVGDAQLVQLQGLSGLRELLIEQGRVTDDGVAPLTTLPRLEHLRIRESRIHDQGLRQICTNGSLKMLNLPHADLTDAGLEALTNLKQLELLRFGSPRVTDAGIATIARIKSLRWLMLIDVPITDLSLRSITQLNGLESFYVDGSHISDAGFAQLFRDRPNLHVHVNQVHHDRDPKNDGHPH